MPQSKQPQAKFKPSRALIEDCRVTARGLRGKPRALHILVWSYLEALASGDEEQIKFVRSLIEGMWCDLRRTPEERAKRLSIENETEPQAASEDSTLDKLNSIFASKRSDGAGGGPK